MRRLTFNDLRRPLQWTVNATRRRHPAILALTATIGLTSLLVILLGPIAFWATINENTLHGKERADAINATRQTLLAAVGGSAVLIGLGFSARTYYLTRRGQLTDRYTKAITQLASEQLTERLGGIYALEHLMTESERDHQTVVDVLAAFIRENTETVHPATPIGINGATKHTPLPPSANTPPRLSTDVQAALTVLGRRPERNERNRISLRRADLRGADLAGARLKNIDLFGAALVHANLFQANLFSANLSRAHLQDARMFQADLRWANLSAALLHEADLYGAQLQDAHLLDTDLDRAVLSDAHLERAKLCDADGEHSATGLIGAQIATAYIDEETVTNTRVS